MADEITKLKAERDAAVEVLKEVIHKHAVEATVYRDCIIDYFRCKLREFGFTDDILDAMERDALSKAGLDAYHRPH